MLEIEKLVNDYNEAKKSFHAAGREALKESFKIIFETAPAVKAFAWTQYAPYFNDGEPCEFGVGDIYATTISPEDEDFSVHELAHGEYCYGENSEETDASHIKEVNEFLKLLSKLPTELYRDLFGSDSLVVVTRGGITVEDYGDHD